jgi:hypothetical protein
MTSEPTALALTADQEKQLRAKIVEANPEIVLSANHPIQNAIARLISSHDNSSLSLREIGGLVGLPDAHPQQIKHHLNAVMSRKERSSLHRPIRLADVLLAMQGRVSEPDAVGITINGEFLDCNDDMTQWYIHDVIWKLRQDSLDDQSDDCKRFLFNLLCTP